MSSSLASAIFLLLMGILHIFILEAKAGTPSVNFIENMNPQFKDFFMAAGYALNATSAKNIITKGASICSCKALCISVSCKAWSVVDTDQGTECRLGDDGPIQSAPYQTAGATYFFLAETVGDYGVDHKGAFFVKISDGMLYEDGKRACESIPGHRLVMTKSKKQIDQLSNLYNVHYVVDLHRFDNGTEYLTWADGTDFHLDGTAYIYASGTGIRYKNDSGGLSAAADVEYKIICQANPKGVDW